MAKWHHKLSVEKCLLSPSYLNLVVAVVLPPVHQNIVSEAGKSTENCVTKMMRMSKMVILLICIGILTSNAHVTSKLHVTCVAICLLFHFLCLTKLFGIREGNILLLIVLWDICQSPSACIAAFYMAYTEAKIVSKRQHKCDDVMKWTVLVHCCFIQCT